jgi:hypothetical protein
MEELIRDWPDNPQIVARQMMAEYGAPDEFTPHMVIWHDCRPWFMTIVYRDETAHEFPFAHTDMLDQSIRYHVPQERVGEIAAFNGSICIERTRGVVTVSGPSEGLNFLAMNLLDDIVHGRADVELARRRFGEVATKFISDESDPYTEGFQFSPAAGDTADLDEAVE